LNAAFYRELVAIFPALTDATTARDFWSVYRNGILHQTVPSKRTSAKRGRQARTLPDGCFTHDISNAIEVDAAGAFAVQPDYFAQTVIARIEADFSTYANAGTFQPPPMRVSVQTVPSPYLPQAPGAVPPFATTTKTN
jgi:hypothetical protein